MFNIWVDGNELKSAKEAWGYLAVAGLTGATTILKRDGGWIGSGTEDG
jgi:hypothetical protein